MPYNYRIIFLSLSIIFSNLMAVENPSLNIKPLDEPEIPEIMRNILNNQQHHHHHEHHHHHYPKQQQTTETIAPSLVFSEIDIEEMQRVLKTSPEEAKFIVKYLQNPEFALIQDYRSATFVGEPGTGKTTTAKAIGHEMSKHGWEVKFLSSTSLLGEYRNQTSIQLQKELQAIEASKKPTILIIDELNRLLENSNSKHHDTDMIATALWAFLDKNRGNKNFFFIGTMNRANKLPKAYKSRILLDYIEFPMVSNSKFKSEFIRRELTRTKITLDSEITDIFLDIELKKMGICSERDLKNLSDAIYKRSVMTGTIPTHDKMIIKKATITHVINQYIQNKSKLDYDTEDETDEERENRYHKENLEMQEMHFMQQQKIQFALHDNQEVSTFLGQSYHSIKKEGKKKINNLFSDEQEKIFEKKMKNTYERRAKECTGCPTCDAKKAAEKANK